MEILSDLTYSRATFFRQHSLMPIHLRRLYLTNEMQMLTLLDRLSRPVVAPPPPPPQIQTTSFDVPLTTFLSGLFPNAATPQFWDAVTIGLTNDQLAAATREYVPSSDIAVNELCCVVCQEGIATEAAVETLCPGPSLPSGSIVTNHHALHRRCAQAWFTISTKCPVCRADLRPREPSTTNAGAAAPGGDDDISGL